MAYKTSSPTKFPIWQPTVMLSICICCHSPTLKCEPRFNHRILVLVQKKEKQCKISQAAFFFPFKVHPGVEAELGNKILIRKKSSSWGQPSPSILLHNFTAHTLPYCNIMASRPSHLIPGLFSQLGKCCQGFSPLLKTSVKNFGYWTAKYFRIITAIQRFKGAEIQSKKKNLET